MGNENILLIVVPHPSYFIKMGVYLALLMAYFWLYTTVTSGGLLELYVI